MHITIKGVNYEVDALMRETAQKKLARCEKLLGTDSHTATFNITLGKETHAHKTGTIWKAEVNLDVQGQRLHAAALEGSLDSAIDTVILELSNEIRKTRGKKQGLLRRGGALVKEFLRRAR